MWTNSSIHCSEETKDRLRLSPKSNVGDPINEICWCYIKDYVWEVIFRSRKDSKTAASTKPILELVVAQKSRNLEYTVVQQVGTSQVSRQLSWVWATSRELNSSLSLPGIVPGPRVSQQSLLFVQAWRRRDLMNLINFRDILKFLNVCFPSLRRFLQDGMFHLLLEQWFSTCLVMWRFNTVPQRGGDH